MRLKVATKKINKIAVEYQWSIEVYIDDLKADIYNVKQKTYCIYGNLGIKIYRDSLSTTSKIKSTINMTSADAISFRKN